MQSETSQIDTICEKIEPLLAGYALGEHDPEARVEIDHHLATCARCSQTLNAYAQVASLIPLSVPEAIPAPELRDRVIAAVDAAARGVPPPVAPRAAQPSLRTWGARLGWLFGALALVIMLVWNVGLQQQIAAEQANRQAAESALATEQVNRQAADAALATERTNREAAEAALATERTNRQATEAALASLLQSPDVARYVLNGQAGTTGQFLLDPDDQTGAVMVSGMPPLDEGRVYQLWLITEGGPVSGGTFRVDSNGRGMLVVKPPQPWDAYNTIGITAEPEGGSPGPTSPGVIGTDV